MRAVLAGTVKTWLLLPLVHGYRHLPKDPIENPGHGIKLSSVPNIHSLPYHVLVFYSNYYCSGTIIGSKVVLTVASCFLKEDVQISVKVGTDSIADEGEIIPVLEYKKHEFYQYRSELDNDIALLILQRDVTFSEKVQKIILLQPEVALRDGSPIVVSGWGWTATTPPRARQVNWASVIVLKNEECSTIFGGLFTSSMFCAEYEVPHGKKTPDRLCDHGGPGVFDEQLLVGVTSFGATHSKDPFIVIFSNVSYFHRWIKINTVRFLSKYCKHDNGLDNTNYFYDSMERI